MTHHLHRKSSWYVSMLLNTASMPYKCSIHALYYSILFWSPWNTSLVFDAFTCQISFESVEVYSPSLSDLNTFTFLLFWFFTIVFHSLNFWNTFDFRFKKYIKLSWRSHLWMWHSTLRPQWMLLTKVPTHPCVWDLASPLYCTVMKRKLLYDVYPWCKIYKHWICNIWYLIEHLCCVRLKDLARSCAQNACVKVL